MQCCVVSLVVGHWLILVTVAQVRAEIVVRIISSGLQLALIIPLITLHSSTTGVGGASVHGGGGGRGHEPIVRDYHVVSGVERSGASVRVTVSSLTRAGNIITGGWTVTTALTG